MEYKDGFTDDTTELAACSLYNLENLTKLIPGLSEHPLYVIAHTQAKALADRLAGLGVDVGAGETK